MKHILNIFKRKNQGSQEPIKRELIGVSGNIYNADYFSLQIEKGYIVDKKTNKIVEVLKGVRCVSKN